MQTDSSLIHADIFFFITTIAVIIVTLIVIVILFYSARIARNVAEISDNLKKESNEMLADIKTFREGLVDRGLKFVSMLDALRRFFGVKTKAEKKKPTRKIRVEDAQE